MTAGGRVLVVDDERLNRTVLRAALTRQGHEVVEAVDGREALDRLAEGPIDVVLLDIVMPVMDGYATLEAIKADPELGHIPVIIISGVDDIASVVRCIEMGAHGLSARSPSSRPSCRPASTRRWRRSGCATSNSSTSSRSRG